MYFRVSTWPREYVHVGRCTHAYRLRYRVSRRYSSSTTGWISTSTSTSGKRRGVRRRERNERLVLDVCRSFFSFPFLFLPSPSRSRGTILFRRFYLRGNSKGGGQRRCNRLWHADVATPTNTLLSPFLSSFLIFRSCISTTLNFFFPSLLLSLCQLFSHSRMGSQVRRVLTNSSQVQLQVKILIIFTFHASVYVFYASSKRMQLNERIHSCM